MIGDTLRNLRTAANKTQQEVADYLEIARGTYAHYEINRREPDIATLKKIATYFSVSIDYLLEYAPDSSQKDSRFEKYERLQKKISSTDPETAAELEQYLNYLESKRNQLSTADHEKK